MSIEIGRKWVALDVHWYNVSFFFYKFVCMLHFRFYNYIHCGAPRSLNMEYTGRTLRFNSKTKREILDHWGGVTFARQSLELHQEPTKDDSVLRHVEIVGGGNPHNESIYMAALQVFRRSPILENVNVTNSSMGGVQVNFKNFRWYKIFR